MTESAQKEDLKSLPFWNSDLDVEERVNDLLGRLTTEEKFTLASGKRIFFTKPIKRLGVPSWKMSDGPHGVGSGIFYKKKMSYFPVAICRAATWNPELSEKFGVALAEELRSVGRYMILAPGINIDRTPLNGRTFEYQCECPYLNKILAVAVVKGLQSQRIAACVKHYACNNQEHNRFHVDAVVGERALQEIYLPAFEAVVREADAWSFMACYNKLNGIHGCEHENLIRERLMKQWGFRGFIVSDWFATRFTDTAKCVNAGTSLEMPFAIAYKLKKLNAALQEGKFTQQTYDDNLRRLLRVMFLTGLFDDKSKLPKGSRNTPEHRELGRQIAEEAMVLLKNENNILPLSINNIKKICVVGPNAKKKLAFGGGSSMVRAKNEITPFAGLKNKCKGKVQLVKEPSEADVVVFVGGLNHGKNMDRENKDKIILELPAEQIEQINATAKQNPKTIVVLINGSPVAMNGWIENVPAVLDMWYAGMEGGNAFANVLFGDVNPSGKLPVTFPKKLSDSPAHKSERTYPGDEKVYYEEGIFVGYRHFDNKNIEPLFPFGHGLSYTQFTYSNLKLSKNQISGNEKLSISLDIVNSGKIFGAEVVQLYIQDLEASVERPLKELKGFKKVKLNPGQKETVKFEVEKNDLSFYDEANGLWKAEKGAFNVLLGSSSRDIRLQAKFEYLI